MIQDVVLPRWDEHFAELPAAIRHLQFCNYRIETRTSTRRRIISSVILTSKTNRGSEVNICHLVIVGSSQWVVGRDVTQLCNIVHIGANVLQFPENAGTILLENHDLLCYVPYSIFCRGPQVIEVKQALIFCATVTLNDTVGLRP